MRGGAGRGRAPAAGVVPGQPSGRARPCAARGELRPAPPPLPGSPGGGRPGLPAACGQARAAFRLRQLQAEFTDPHNAARVGTLTSPALNDAFFLKSNLVTFYSPSPNEALTKSYFSFRLKSLFLTLAKWTICIEQNEHRISSSVVSALIEWRAP